MSQIIQEYFKETIKQYQSGQATEHSYRPALIDLLKKLNPSLLVLNETQKVSVGRPDLLIKKGEITIACLEAKDVIVPLDDKTNQEQLHRYLGAFDNFCYTNSLEFRFYKNKQLVDTVIVAKIEGGKIITIESAYERLENQLKDFLSYAGHNITSSKRLAEIMAGKARMLNDVILKVLQQENESSLHDQYKAFKEVLIHDITMESFSDMYSQTLVYGLFVARLHDTSLEDFSRQEAERLIPKSNPFLRELFHYIAFDLEEKITWIVDSLVEIFAHCDIGDILKDFGKTTQRNDPVVHFYETFLSHYNPDTRKARGVYYTPEPVVSFIIKGIDCLLKHEFDIADGIADREKIEVKKTIQGKVVPKQEHRVQVLDVATGTGTFLNEIIKFIYNNNPQFASGGMRPMYVEEHLLPRLFGFELLMASYTMCHLKLGLTLKETGYTDEGKKRLGIYLTNSLEEAEENMQSLFASYLSREAQQASDIKKQSPIMVITGNPPYSVSSTNKSPWIQKLIEDYKKDLNEKKLNLDDDYIKFIRYAQHFIDKNGEGVVGMITNNSYIDGVTHRQMRKSLLESFDKIYVYDLHGNAKKKETTPDGGKDENVFDIMQGVSIIFAVKSSKSKKQAEVYHYDSRGKRDIKYNDLWNTSVDSIKRTKLTPVEPYYFFVPKDFGAIKDYEKGIKVDELFSEYVSGFQTKRDHLTIQYTLDGIQSVIEDFKNLDSEDLRRKYKLPDDGRDWKIGWAKDDIINNNPKIIDVLYRPFDKRKTLFTGKSKGFIAYPRNQYVTGLNFNKNISLITCRQESTFDFQHIFVSYQMSDMCSISSQTKETGYVFPLYLYDSDDDLGEELFTGDMCRPNFRDEAISKIEKSLGLQIAIGEPGGGEPESFFTPEDLFDYIYAVLHSPTYRETYKEFLKIDFPRIPFDVSKDNFWKLVKKGGELRKFHLMEHLDSNKLITKYPIAGDNFVKKIKFVDGKVYINDTQYFDDVPESAWNFYVGGYQPAQKWLKDRAERALSFDDILHWQKIIVALVNTERLMKEIEEVKFI